MGMVNHAVPKGKGRAFLPLSCPKIVPAILLISCALTLAGTVRWGRRGGSTQRELTRLASGDAGPMRSADLDGLASNLTAEEKVRLLDAAIIKGPLEFDVRYFNVLLPLYSEFEGLQRYFVHGLHMDRYDKSCAMHFRDSASHHAFNKSEFYADIEYRFKVIERAKDKRGEGNCDLSCLYGCCSCCRTDRCCLCSYDRGDVREDILKRSHGLQLFNRGGRGFSLSKTPEFVDGLKAMYASVLYQLGFRETGRKLRSMTHVKNLPYFPPGGFLMWHTNKHDNNNVPFRIYFVSVSEDGKSFFKYRRNDGSQVALPDRHGTFRLLRNTYPDPHAANGENYMWHTVYSEGAHRHTLGFEIPLDVMTRLVDDCGTRCWRNVLLGGGLEGDNGAIHENGHAA